MATNSRTNAQARNEKAFKAWVRVFACAEKWGWKAPATLRALRAYERAEAFSAECPFF